ncbi:MAG TPA: glycoside hydrolase family 27 protein [Aeromicrobium sp.]|nr:glycoside hydrolase family 27 protein [Aeromicrobium sp.]
MTGDFAASQRKASAPTPPMGWNSWNTFRCYDLTEQVVVQTAEAMVASSMKDAGYEYVVVDDCWQEGTRGEDGRLRAHRGRFPSGMAALGEQIHDLGLKFGLYASPGRRTCAMIYDRYPGIGLGSFSHEQLDADSMADWGVDYLKYDWCRANRGGTKLDEPAAFAHMAQAIQNTGRPMVYSISEYGRSKPWEWAPQVANLWRTTPDIGPSWRSVMRIADKQHGLAQFAGPGHWNDPDMLEVGNAGLSPTESRSHLMLWAMLAAPLMAGNDVRSMSAQTRDLLTDSQILSIAMDPAGRQGERTGRRGKLDFWRRELSDGFAVGVLNRARSARGLTTEDRDRLGDLTGAVDITSGEIGRFDLTLASHEMRIWRVRS